MIFLLEQQPMILLFINFQKNDDFSKKTNNQDQSNKEQEKRQIKQLYKTMKVSFRATTKTTLLLY